MTTGGEGGMIVTNREGLAERCWSFKDHGKSRGAMSRPMNGSKFRWVHESVGTNLRLTEFQSAIGRIQLAGLDDAVTQRNRNAAVLFDRLGEQESLRLPRVPVGYLHAFYKCYVFIKTEELNSGWSRDRILSELNGYGVPCGSGICPEVYLEQAFMNLDIAPADYLPVARHLGETSLMFRVDPALSSRHMDLAADTLIDVIGRACH